MLRLDDLIGNKVEISIVGAEKPIYAVILHAVENGGIWIESADFEKLASVVSTVSRNRPQQKPIFFVPFARIQFLISYSTDLDEKSLLP